MKRQLRKNSTENQCRLDRRLTVSHTEEYTIRGWAKLEDGGTRAGGGSWGRKSKKAPDWPGPHGWQWTNYEGELKWPIG